MKSILSIAVSQILLCFVCGEDEIAAGNLSYFECKIPGQVADAFSFSVRSTGRTVKMPVRKGGRYQILIIAAPNQGNEQVVFNETVTPGDSTLDVGVFFSWKYEIEDGSIKIDNEKHQVTLQLDADIKVKPVKWASEHLESVASKTFLPTENKAVFMVLFHPNRMGPSNFSEAVDFAMNETSYGEIVAMVKALPEIQGEPSSAGKPEKRRESVDSSDSNR